MATDDWPEPKRDPDAERRRRLAEAEEAVKLLAGLEEQLVTIAYAASMMWLEVHRIETKLRVALGQPPPDAPPPLIETMAKAREGEDDVS